jgi:hypothetical protein
MRDGGLASPGPGDAAPAARSLQTDQKTVAQSSRTLTVKSSIGMSPFELPAARSGRRPVRLQMRIGFSGPSSR